MLWLAGMGLIYTDARLALFPLVPVISFRVAG